MVRLPSSSAALTTAMMDSRKSNRPSRPGGRSQFRVSPREPLEHLQVNLNTLTLVDVLETARPQAPRALTPLRKEHSVGKCVCDVESQVLAQSHTHTHTHVQTESRCLQLSPSQCSPLSKRRPALICSSQRKRYTACKIRGKK